MIIVTMIRITTIRMIMRTEGRYSRVNNVNNDSNGDCDDNKNDGHDDDF